MDCLIPVVLFGGGTRTHEVNVLLADLADGRLAIHPSADATTIDITLAFATADCAALDHVGTGTLDGEPLHVISLGHRTSGFPSCETPTFLALTSPSSA